VVTAWIEQDILKPQSPEIPCRQTPEKLKFSSKLPTGEQGGLPKGSVRKGRGVLRCLRRRSKHTSLGVYADFPYGTERDVGERKRKQKKEEEEERRKKKEERRKKEERKKDDERKMMKER